VIELELMIIFVAAVVTGISVIFRYDLLLDDLWSDSIRLYVFEGEHSPNLTIIVGVVMSKLVFIVIFEVNLLIQVERLLDFLFDYFVLAFSKQIFNIQTVSLRIAIGYVILVIVELLLTFQGFYEGNQF